MVEPKDLIERLRNWRSASYDYEAEEYRKILLAVEAATCIETLADENAALREKLAEREWQPIESAPKDGTDVHVISTKWLVPVPAHFVSREFLEREYGDPEYMEDGWYPSYRFLFDLPEVKLEPTHWMPLPEPPALTGGDNAGG